MERKEFRVDLFYRLNVVSLHVPPLPERPEEIPKRVDHFLSAYRQRFNRPRLSVSNAARQCCWIFLARQCARIEKPSRRAAAISPTDTIEADQIHCPAANADDRGRATPDVAPLKPEELEGEHILRVLEQSGGNRERAAAILGISSRTLYRKLREYETNGRPSGLATIT